MQFESFGGRTGAKTREREREWAMEYENINFGLALRESINKMQRQREREREHLEAHKVCSIQYILKQLLIMITKHHLQISLESAKCVPRFHSVISTMEIGWFFCISNVIM